MSARTYPAGWTARDVADHEIVEALLPLMELADAFGTLVELIGERLMARFGYEEEHPAPDAGVAECWERVMGFAEYAQAMIEADRPGLMRGQCRLVHVHGSGHRAVLAAASADDSPCAISPRSAAQTPQ